MTRESGVGHSPFKQQIEKRDQVRHADIISVIAISVLQDAQYLGQMRKTRPESFVTGRFATKLHPGANITGARIPAEVPSNYASMGMWRNALRRIPPIGFFLVEIRGAGPCRGVSTGFMVASGGGLSGGYGHDGPGVCLGDGQTKAYLKDMGMTGLASALAMVRRRPI